MIAALLLGLVGLMLSSFFSGSETGFYRVTRVRLQLDAMEGDLIARGLWWLVNRPALFVGTMLVGNNLANYLVSLATVMGSQALALGGAAAEIATPIVLAPVLFVYGELLPKQLYFEAPYRLLRRSGPLLLLFGLLFLPLSAVLFGFGRLLELLAGQSHQQLKLLLARRELQNVLEEGHEAGILRPAQRQLAQGLFAVANEPVGQFAIPAHRIARVRLGMSRAEVLRLARRHGLSAVPVEEPLGRRKLIGYVRVVDLHMDPRHDVLPVRPLSDIHHKSTHISALFALRASGEPMARVVDDRGNTVGIVTDRRLGEPLFRGGR